MKLNTITRTGGVAASLALVLGLGLSACGSDDSGSDSTSGSDSSESTSEETEATEAGAQTFGEGCKLIPADGEGSFNGMATAPVASAASANPLLTTLVTAVGEADLVDTLNGADALTVFAPTDDAFAKIPKADLDAVLADKETLTTVLTHHVVAGQLGPDEVAGEHETLAGDMIAVEGSGEEFTVGKENAKVLCGNIPTANATVYVVDTVLMP
ncbi:putative surface protein with fasciclin (FAS1) repeats [Nocardioides luteus]|uniref:Lipoprotein n=1 Tax=Nocardioides luteus TaxID=1844 RepID=A0ABQ5T2G7_9ACTN|nr:fasciclin domain-containing protein [Nocardioides luteus]MDR7313703.1 putative surface protein with fasciclin (FAS1) repeats [Nocardioides luteus]GGR63917.1 lipoprotein [Nocardioides luteus]GLJ70449.1 lipoprotein [Nocardioides luteus]